MDFETASGCCHVRSAIYRKSKPEKKYWKNNLKTLKEQVPQQEQLHEDWEEYDPRENDNGSLFMFND